MENNNSNTKPIKAKYDTKQLDECIREINMPITLTGIVLKDTTNSLADKIVAMYNDLGIPELEHCMFYPRHDKTGELVDFDAVLYFNTQLGNKPKNIYRLGTGSSARTQDGRPDLMRLTAGRRTSSGAFNISDKFRFLFASVAATDKDGNILIESADNAPHIAVVECKFFELLNVCLGVRSDDNFDYTVAECIPRNNTNGTPDFALVIVKEMLTGSGRRAKSGMNYAALDNKRINRHKYN